MSFNQNKRSRGGPNWSELKPELLESIASKLSCPDIQRFKSTCSSWRNAAEYIKSGPLLLVPSTQEDQETIRLGVFSVKDKTTHDLKLIVNKSEDILNSPEEIHFVGSSHGWMIVVDKMGEPFLWNLFSRDRIDLPGKSKIQGLPKSLMQSYSPVTKQRFFIHKAILTANPSCTTENYVVVIIHDFSKKLAFCSKGDGTWTGFGDSKDYYDIMYSGEMLYSLREKATIEGWQFSETSSDPIKKLCIKPSFNANMNLSSDRCTSQWYLVPSNGEILFIVRYIGEFVNEKCELLCEAELPDDGDQICCYRTIKFEVYKLDRIKEKLVRETSLKNQLVFVGGNHGISLPFKDYQGFKPNSIYFTDDYWDRIYKDYYYGGHDIGVFSLEDERISEVYECDSRFEPIPFWVLSN
ncbi:OLC1v1019479C1 [Oldenlandia corymbosa var. corymbosa]|uniref:OLC1v1019479C1 n=1 Tax=Oldenlandia corymbosa var. corymbosa TaxID=529605 RepID=A0AAV1EE15_OLDCO|nr:OLC1v1019479C1 [Oldenlandia corymbosa var. corymbosa]